MQNRCGCVFLRRKVDASFLDELLHFGGHDCGSDKPRSDDVYSHPHLRHRSTQRPHDATDAPFRSAVLGRAWLIQVASETCSHDKAPVTALWIAVQVVHCEFGSVHYADQVCFDDSEVGFNGFIGVWSCVCIYSVRGEESLSTGSRLRRTITPDCIRPADTCVRDDDVYAFRWRLGYGCFEEVDLIGPGVDVAFGVGCVLSEYSIS